MKGFFIALLFVSCSFGQQLVKTISIDTSMYTKQYVWATYGPGQQRMNPFALVRKNSNVVDIFSYLDGLIGSTTIPNLPAGSVATNFMVSQTYFDSDNGWEGYVNFYDTTGWANGQQIKWQFIAFSETGATVLADNGYANVYYDDNSTYLAAGVYSGALYMNTSIKTWNLRSDLPIVNHLSKRTANPVSEISYYPSGNLQVIASPTASGQLTVQIIDMLGRQVFLKDVDISDGGTHLSISSTVLPRSPFIARASTGISTSSKFVIPTK